MTTIGIDVGSKELVVAIRHKMCNQKVKAFPNTPAGFKRIKKLCSKYLKYGKVMIAMEATGVYHLDIAIALASESKFNIMVVNPLATKSFARALMERNKTDKVDAQVLALFAEKMEYPLWKKPSEEVINLRYYARMLNVITIDKTRAKNYLHSLTSFSEVPKQLIEFAQQEIVFFEKMINNIKQEILELIVKDKQLEESFNLIKTIKGFGDLSAIQVLAEVLFIPKGLTHKQWVAFAGLDPKVFQSGTSINRKPRISKAGNRHLRKALFMPALCASRNDSYVKKYFMHLVENRKLSKLQAIVAVMRKLLHAIHGMLLHRKPFDNTRFFGQKFA